MFNREKLLTYCQKVQSVAEEEDVNIPLPDAPTSLPEWNFYPEWARVMLRVSGDINAISSEMRLLRRGDAGQESYNDKQVDKVHLQLVYYYIHLCLDFGRKIRATGESGG